MPRQLRHDCGRPHLGAAPGRAITSLLMPSLDGYDAFWVA